MPAAATGTASPALAGSDDMIKYMETALQQVSSLAPQSGFYALGVELKAGAAHCDTLQLVAAVRRGSGWS